MKTLTIPADSLKQAFVKLGLAVLSNPVIPQLKHIYFRVTPGQAELITTNMDITILYRLACETKETFEFLIPFDFLSKIVTLNPHCPLVIESGKKVKISGSNDQFELSVGEKVSEYPKVPELPKKNSISIGSDVLNSLQVAIATCGKPDPKPSLAHVLLELSPSKVTVASTDGSYMVYSKEFVSEQVDTQKLLIRQNVIKALAGCDSVNVFYHSKAIGFESDQLTIIANRSEDKYVNFRHVFPDEWPGNLTIQKGHLVNALGKCSLSTDMLRTTIISLNEFGKIKLSAEDNFVHIEAEASGQYSGEVPSVSINSDKLLKLLGQIEHDDIQLAIHNANRAILITSNEDPGYKGMIMPISQTQK